MVAYCSAYKCTNKHEKGSNVSFHSFPNDLLLRKKWVIATKRGGFIPTASSKLCSEHFNPDDFVWQFGRKIVKADIVPSNFSFPEDLKEKQVQPPSKILTAVTSEESLRIITEDLEENVLPVSHTIQELDELPQFVADSSDDPSIFMPQSTTTQEGKKSQPVYMGDISKEDFYKPEKFKIMWKIATKMINNHKKTISYLRTKTKRLNKRVNSLNDLIEQLKTDDKISTNCKSLLKVATDFTNSSLSGNGSESTSNN